MATLMERLAFLQKVPTLMKATADDEAPCPGYLFEEINKISHESVGCCQCLLEYLLERLQVESCHVKLKVLKILLHLCGHGPPHFLTELRRNATFIQEVTVYSGPPDPIHGNAPFQRVRVSAQELASVLFNDTLSANTGLSPCKAATPSLGMGSESLRSGMQGFGNSPGRKPSNRATLLDKIQKAAEVVASAVLPPTEQPGIRLHDNLYRAVVAPSAAVEVAVPACAYNVSSHSHKASHRCPGQAGGGWEETSSGHSSSHNSSLEIEPLSHTSRGNSSKSGETGSHSGASRESGELSERVEAMQLGDCGQEMALISNLTNGSKIFLSRDESQHFIKECSILNCEVVVELLSQKLKDSTQTVQMRALCGLACLMSTDLLSLDQIFCVTHKPLAQLSEGAAGPVANKATKLLRQFEALLGSPTPVTKSDIMVCPESSSPSLSGQPLDSTLASPLLPTPLDAVAPSGISSTHCPQALSSRLGLEQEKADSVAEESAHGAQLEEKAENQQAIHEDRDRPREPCEAPEPLRHHPTLSLFSGMELVNRGKPVCLVEPVPVEQDSQTGAEGYTDLAVKRRTEKSSDSSSSELQHSTGQVSAFSFLNL
ncbi:AP-4 complex accessory subunit Tepsin [Colossoma macropomum]|uniref:AP-4 complex accessory subunit Tepsin n=1 Tax=Colossoma macropomum TaxID=42526 RepID=UPI0018649E90|nr:AP-4 complex accessory subunit Tepsin [Colossoma macropomum]